MKCPKCGYLGFETTDRCRNCGYDFSLAPFSSEPDLALRSTDKNIEPAADFDLPGLARSSDSNGGTLDLDRLFGEPEDSTSRRAMLPNTQVVDLPPVPHDEPVYVTDSPLPVDGDDVAAMAIEPTPAAPPMVEAAAPLSMTAATAAASETPAEADPGALPFEDTPHVAPPPARTPLAVRRATPEIPRGRSRTTTRPLRTSSLLGLDPAPAAAAPVAPAAVAVIPDPPSLGARVSADAIDSALLATIYGVVGVLTLRIAGLTMTVDDLKVVPIVPFVSFVLLFAFVYFAAFTVAGGQTIGKMLMGIKVIGDDGRSVDAAGSILRAIGCALVPLTLGLSYIPVLLTSDRRALHDRLAGTRVVSR